MDPGPLIVGDFSNTSPPFVQQKPRVLIEVKIISEKSKSNKSLDDDDEVTCENLYRIKKQISLHWDLNQMYHLM